MRPVLLLGTLAMAAASEHADSNPATAQNSLRGLRFGKAPTATEEEGEHGESPPPPWPPGATNREVRHWKQEHPQIEMRSSNNDATNTGAVTEGESTAEVTGRMKLARKKHEKNKREDRKKHHKDGIVKRDDVAGDPGGGRLSAPPGRTKTKGTERKKEKKVKKEKVKKEKKVNNKTNKGKARFGTPDAIVTPAPVTPAPVTPPPTPPPTSRPTLMPTEEPTTPEPSWSPTPGPVAPVADALEGVGPTASPSMYPTWSPVALPPCPPQYDTLASYVAGNTIEMNSHIFVCMSGDYEPFCNVVEMDDAWDDATKELWKGAWDHIGGCTAEIGGGDVKSAASGEVEHVEAAAAVEDVESTVVEQAPEDEAASAIEAIEAIEAEVVEAIETSTVAEEAPDDETTSAIETIEAEAIEAIEAIEATEGVEAGSANATVDVVIFDAPTVAPSREIPPCPPPYDTSTRYDAGVIVEVEGFIFECNTEAEVYQVYCNIPEWSDDLVEENEHALDLWNAAWVPVGPCAAAT